MSGGEGGAVVPAEEAQARIDGLDVARGVQDAGLHVGVFDGDAEAGGQVEGAGVRSEPGFGAGEGLRGSGGGCAGCGFGGCSCWTVWEAK